MGKALLSFESRSVSQKGCTYLHIELVLVGGAHEPSETIRLLRCHSQDLNPCHKNTHYRYVQDLTPATRTHITGLQDLNPCHKNTHYMPTRPEPLPQEHTLQVYKT